jgi:hypothetical protein
VRPTLAVPLPGVTEAAVKAEETVLVTVVPVGKRPLVTLTS